VELRSGQQKGAASFEYVHYEHLNKYNDKKQGPISRPIRVLSELDAYYVNLGGSQLHSNA
jgi:hypothetical protein